MDEALKRSARYRIHELRSTTKSAVGALRPET